MDRSFFDIWSGQGLGQASLADPALGGGFGLDDLQRSHLWSYSISAFFPSNLQHLGLADICSSSN